MRQVLFGAIEAGGSKFICAVADDSGNILADTRILTSDPVTTLNAALDFFTAQSAQLGSYAGFGIASFGPLDLRPTSPTYGHLLATPKPLWSHVDLCGPFTARFDCEVVIDTDVNCAALAETRHGAGRDCENVVYVTVGTGIGGGIVVNDKPLHGALHPEMGHIPVVKHPLDHSFTGICPFHTDCLEGLASGPAIIARYGLSLDQLPATHEAIKLSAHYLAQLACNIILLLSPQRLIFGGGVMHCAALLPLIRQETVRYLNAYAGLGDPAQTEKLIVAPALGERSGIMGALELVQNR